MVTRSKLRRTPSRAPGVLLGMAAGVGLLAFTVPPVGPLGLVGLVLGAVVGAVWGSVLGSLDGLVASIRREVEAPVGTSRIATTGAARPEPRSTMTPAPCGCGGRSGWS